MNVKVTAAYLETWHSCFTGTFVMTKEMVLGKRYWQHVVTGTPLCDLAWNDGRRHNRSSLRSIATFITFCHAAARIYHLLEGVYSPVGPVIQNYSINMFP